MNKKVLILSGSPRKGGNSDLLCGEFARGAQENGNEVEIIRVAAKKIAPCSGCYYCRAHNGECAHKDDMAEVLQKMIDADVIVMVSPVYFYSIDAQLKAVNRPHGGALGWKSRIRISITSSPWRTRTFPLPTRRWPACAVMPPACAARRRRACSSAAAYTSRAK